MSPRPVTRGEVARDVADRVILVALALVSTTGALAASVTGLAHVADKAGATSATIAGHTIPLGAIGLVLSLDGLALAAGWASHGRHRDAWSVAMLATSASVSAALQAWAVDIPAGALYPGGGAELVSRGVHAIPPIAAVCASALAGMALHRVLDRGGRSGGTATTRRTGTVAGKSGNQQATPGRTPPPVDVAPAGRKGPDPTTTSGPAPLSIVKVPDQPATDQTDAEVVDPGDEDAVTAAVRQWLIGHAPTTRNTEAGVKAVTGGRGGRGLARTVYKRLTATTLDETGS